MTSMFSAISGQFTRLLIFGTLLPTLAFALLAVLLVGPLVSSDPALFGPLLAVAADWKALVWTAAVVVASGLLFNLNIALIRVYEGYPWRETWIGRRLVARSRSRVERAAAAYTRLAAVRAHLGAGQQELRSHVQARLNSLGHLLNAGYPGSGLVMPTRLGNVVRSFEEYPRYQYGISAIALWPRLIAKIDKDYGVAMDEAKASFDFMLNASFLSSLLSALVLVAGVAGGRPFATSTRLSAWLVVAGSCAALGYLLYRGAVSRAVAWGTHVKGAFDLYRHALLAGLGYQQKPRTRAAERELWRAVSRQMIFGDPFTGTPPDYAPPPPPDGGNQALADDW